MAGVLPSILGYLVPRIIPTKIFLIRFLFSVGNKKKWRNLGFPFGFCTFLCWGPFTEMTYGYHYLGDLVNFSFRIFLLKPNFKSFFLFLHMSYWVFSVLGKWFFELLPVLMHLAQSLFLLTQSWINTHHKRLKVPLLWYQRDDWSVRRSRPTRACRNVKLPSLRQKWFRTVSISFCEICSNRPVSAHLSMSKGPSV